MKKININFIGSDDGYDEIAGGNRYPKWDFKSPMGASLECVLMDRKTLPQKQGSGTYDIYTVIEKNTKKPYAFFCGKVLEDKLKNIPLYSLVKIIFEGVHPTKRYHIYKVALNRNFKYDPAQFNLDDFQEVKADGASSPAPVENHMTNSRTPAAQIEEDLPF